MAIRDEFLCRNAQAIGFGNLDLAPSAYTLASSLLPNSPLIFGSGTIPRVRARVVCRRTISDENQIQVSTQSPISDFEETWKRRLPPAPEKAATVATSATHDR